MKFNFGATTIFLPIISRFLPIFSRFFPTISRYLPNISRFFKESMKYRQKKCSDIAQTYKVINTCISMSCLSNYYKVKKGKEWSVISAIWPLQWDNVTKLLKLELSETCYSWVEIVLIRDRQWHWWRQCREAVEWSGKY